MVFRGMRIKLLRVRELFLRIITIKQLLVIISGIIISIYLGKTYQSSKTWEQCQDSVRVVKGVVVDRYKHISENSRDNKYYLVVRRDIDKIIDNYEVTPEKYYDKTIKYITYKESRYEWDPDYFDNSIFIVINFALIISLIGYLLYCFGKNRDSYKYIEIILIGQTISISGLVIIGVLILIGLLQIGVLILIGLLQ